MKIAVSVVLALLILGCSDEKRDSTQDEISKSVQNIAEVVKKESKNISKTVENATQDSVATVKKEVKEASKTVLKETKKVAQKTLDTIDEALEEPKAKESTLDAQALFSKCSSCHGVNADKKALNKSQSIRAWSVDKLITAINGYKDGSYGGSMKGVMKAQVSKLSDDEVKALAEYISKL